MKNTTEYEGTIKLVVSDDGSMPTMTIEFKDLHPKHYESFLDALFTVSKHAAKGLGQHQLWFGRS